MKQLKILPLVAIISGVMVGCGGGSGGSSGGGKVTPTDYVTLTFIQKVTSDEKPAAGCTIFAEETENETVKYTYARQAANVTVYIHDDAGQIIETLKPNASGSLTIDKYPLDDGSYVTIIDSPSDNDPFYKALSIEKAYLESQLVQVNRPQVGSCYNADSNSTLNTGYVLASTLNARADSYQFLSSQEDVVTVTANSSEVTKYTNESVLVKGYYNDKLSGYRFISEMGTTAESPKIAVLETLDTDVYWSNQISPATALEELNISLSSGDYTYFWEQPDISTEESFPISSIESGYQYQASGTLNTGWKFKTVGEFSADLDVKLPDSLQVHDVEPSIVSSGLNGAVQVNGIDSSRELVLRAKYYQTASSPELRTLEHVIIGQPTEGELMIPDLSGTGLSAVNPDTLSVDAYEFDVLTESQIQNLLSQYENDDVVAFVVKPSQREKHTTVLSSAEYTQLSR